MRYTIHIGNKPIILEHDNLDSTINIDDLTTVDTSNLFGEAVTVSAAANRIGLLRSEVESNMALAKLELKIFEANFRSRLRKQAAENSGFFNLVVDEEEVKVKLTEKALESSFENDSKWVALQKDYIKAEKDFNALSALYWAIQNKSRTINNVVGGTTPEDFVSELVEGKVNGILIKKK